MKSMQTSVLKAIESRRTPFFCAALSPNHSPSAFRRLVFSLFVVLACGLNPLVVFGSGPYFCAVSYNGSFTQIDAAMGPIPPSRSGLPTGLQALAYSPAGVLYAGKANMLYTVDPRTGHTTSVLPLTTDVRGMAFSPAGMLYVTAGTGDVAVPQSLRWINQVNGSHTAIGDLWGDGISAQGLDFSPGGVLYAITPADPLNSPHGYVLYTVDLDDAEMHKIGQGTVDINQSLAFTSGGSLYVLGDNYFTQMNPATGATIGASLYVGVNYRGLAVVPPLTNPGPPSVLNAWDNGGGQLELEWQHFFDAPNQFLALAYDIYAENWVYRGVGGTLWFPFGAWTMDGQLDLFYSGGYHAWISSHYFPGPLWYPCPNPWTGIIYSGTPHKPLSVTAAPLGPLNVRLQWKPDLYGTCLYWIIAYDVDAGQFVNTQGPLGDSLWHYVLYGSTPFNIGAAEFGVPSDGNYKFYIAALGWDGLTLGEFAIAPVTVPPSP